MDFVSFLIIYFLIIAAIVWLTLAIDRFAKKTGRLWLSSFTDVALRLLIIGSAILSIVFSLEGVSKPGYTWSRHIGTITINVALLLFQLPWRSWFRTKPPAVS